MSALKMILREKTCSDNQRTKVDYDVLTSILVLVEFCYCAKSILYLKSAQQLLNKGLMLENFMIWILKVLQQYLTLCANFVGIASAQISWFSTKPIF